MWSVEKRTIPVRYCNFKGTIIEMDATETCYLDKTYQIFSDLQCGPKPLLLRSHSKRSWYTTLDEFDDVLIPIPLIATATGSSFGRTVSVLIIGNTSILYPANGQLNITFLQGSQRHFSGRRIATISTFNRVERSTISINYRLERKCVM